MNYDNDTCLFQTLRYLTRTNAEVSTIKKREIFSNLASTEIYDIHPAAVTPTSSISDQTKLPLDSPPGYDPEFTLYVENVHRWLTYR